MNNQRRHQLERNVLADQIGTSYDRFQKVAKLLGIGILVALVGTFGYQLFKGQAVKTAAKDWTEFYFNRTAGDADSYAALSSDFGNAAARQWAQHSAAKGYYRDGVNALFKNRKEGVDNIRKAIEQWEKIQDASIPELRMAAFHGLGHAYESLGELDKAVGYLQQLADMPESTEDQRSRINEQITFLKSADTKSFYSWFNQLDPKPSAGPTLQGDLSQPPSSPSITLDPLNLPDLSAPATPEAAAPEVPATVEPPAQAPAPVEPDLPAEPPTPAAPSDSPENPVVPSQESDSAQPAPADSTPPAELLK